ncbi:hypothetical protein [Bartonella sp. CL42QHWL]
MDLRAAQYNKSNNTNKKHFVAKIHKQDVRMARYSYGAVRKT